MRISVRRSLVPVLTGAAGLFALLLQPAIAHEIVSGTLTIEHPWVASARRGSAGTAGYVIGIKNMGDADERLVGATIEGAKPGVIRRKNSPGSSVAYEVIKDGVAVPPHGEAGLMPGQAQIYFEDVSRALPEGETVKGSLIFAKAGAVAVDFMIEPADLASEDAPAASHMHMDHMH